MRIGPATAGFVGALAVWLGFGAGVAWAQTAPVPAPVAVAIAAPAPAPPDEAAGSTDSLKMVLDASSRLTLPVMVNGRGPYNFLVDTGSERSVISRELAAVLDLPPGPAVRVHQTTGDDLVRTVVIDHLAVGVRGIDHVEAPALAAQDLGAAGLLGVDALRDLHIVMDFQTMRMSSAPSRPEPFDPHTIVVRGRSRFGQLILVNANVRGVPVYVVLDSGSQLSVGNPALLKLLTGHSVGVDPPKTTELISVTGRRMTVELDQIAEANVGGIAIHNMILAFAPSPLFGRFGLDRQPAMFLGMDVLRQCLRVSVDLHRKEATFTLR